MLLTRKLYPVSSLRFSWLVAKLIMRSVIIISLARLRGLGHFRGFGPLKINELIKKVFTTAGAGARATEWNLGRDLDIADQRELAEGACERQSDTFRISWQ